MGNLEQIQSIISKNLIKFEDELLNVVHSDVLLTNEICEYLFVNKGKNIRPTLIFLMAGVFGGITEKTYRAAFLHQILHSATLIHDDVVDDNNIRRNRKSIKAIWGNQIAVLIGDYLFSKGLSTSLENNDYDLLKIISNAINCMSEGEILQQMLIESINTNYQQYYNIINKKTASLLTSCAFCGAISANTQLKELEIRHIKEFGENLGMAFQIKDDILDFNSAEEIGKSQANDIKEKKLTLPTIHYLNNCSTEEKKNITDTIFADHQDENKILELANKIKNSDSIDYAYSIIEKYKNKALENLTFLPKSDYTNACIEIINFTCDRKY